MMRKPRRYIRRAIENINREFEARPRAARLAEASREVREESMRVNAEFAEIERGGCRTGN